MYQRILVCLDNSDHTSAVAHAAADLAARYKAHALLLCVHKHAEADNLPYSALSAQSIINRHSEQLHKQTQEAEQIFKERNALCDVCHRTGDPVEVIVQTAREQCADVIVMSSGEPKKWWGWLEKSVGEQIASQASCTLVQVPPTLPALYPPIQIGGLGRESWESLIQSK